MQNRLTIKDIARLSGVGKSTVSRVLNNESGVSIQTRERVEAVMQQHGFSPSRSARDASGFASVCYDDERAIQMLLEKLYAQGHRHISYLGVPASDTTTGQRRHDAYLHFCEQHQMQPVAVLPGLAMKQGYEQVARVLTPDTTALVCATDTLALGASKYLQEQRITDLQLASVGNTPLMKFLHPEIVTVDPGYGEAGRMAATQLIDQITGRADPRTIIVPARLG